MRTSQDGILTTHVGSLPRSEPLMQMLLDKEQGKALDEATFESQVSNDLTFILHKQHEVGIDIPNDSELPRLGFSFYVMVAHDVVWEKLRMLSEGAKLATARLFS